MVIMVRAAQEAKTRLRQKLEIVYEQRCSIVRSTSQVLQLWSYWVSGRIEQTKEGTGQMHVRDAPS